MSDTGVLERAKLALDTWNRAVSEPVPCLRFPCLSDVVEFEELSAGHFAAATAASYWVETKTEIETRTGGTAPRAAYGTAKAAEAILQLPRFRPMPASLDTAATIEEPTKHIVEVETRPCDPCRATGEVDCGSCQGRGRVTCRACQGAGRRSERQTFRSKCERCSGRGYLLNRCATCDQRGWVLCTSCEPDGMVRTYRTKSDGTRERLTQIECAACGRSHQRRCPTCKGDKVVRGQACPPVTETQRNVTVDCVACATRGDVACDRCKTRGKLRCTTCDGHRSIHLCTLVRRIAHASPLGAWRSGQNEVLISKDWVDRRLSGNERGRLFEIQPFTHGQDAQSTALHATLAAANAGFLGAIDALRPVHAGGTVLVATTVAPVVAFTASVGSWQARFVSTEGGPTFSSSTVAPTSEAQSRLRDAAYARWRIDEIPRRQTLFEAAVNDAARRREQASEAARRARPLRIAGLVAVLGFFSFVVVAWWMLTQSPGVMLDDGGLMRRVDPIYGWFILAILGAAPIAFRGRALAGVISRGLSSLLGRIPRVPDPARPELPDEVTPAGWSPPDGFPFDATSLAGEASPEAA